MFVVNSGNLLASINGMMPFISHIEQLYEAFSVHSIASVSLAGAPQKTCDIRNHISKSFHEAQTRVQEQIAERKEVQGLEGACSTKSLFVINTLKKLPGKIKEMYPQLREF